MASIAGAVGSQILSAVIAAVLTGFGGLVRWFVIRRLPARRTWRFSDASRLSVVLDTSYIDTGRYQRPVAGLGQVRALFNPGCGASPFFTRTSGVLMGAHHCPPRPEEGRNGSINAHCSSMRSLRQAMIRHVTARPRAQRARLGELCCRARSARVWASSVTREVRPVQSSVIVPR